MRLVVITSWALVLGCALAGCRGDPLVQGEGCERNSDCIAPLICEIHRCRRQCMEVRDCPAGLRCLPISKDFGGACQLPDEAVCTLNSDCSGSLVCQMGTCAAVCATDRDCISGSCVDDGAGGTACVEAQPELCIYNSDCPAGQICDPDQVCREECLDDRDCRFPRVCDAAQNLCIIEPCMSDMACVAPRVCLEQFCQPRLPAGGGM